MTRQSWIIGTIAFVALALSPLIASAQTSLATADANGFMGVWTLSLESPRGPFEQELTFKDKDGKVSAELNSQMQPAPQAISDISKSGSDLVLKFQGDFQGNAFDATITLTPDGADKAKVVFDINGGQFSMSGSGTRK